MQLILEQLKCVQTRDTTAQTYRQIWTQFNKFVIKLDIKPKLWEDRVALYCAHLIQNGIQSSTLKSYISAIKAILKTDGYMWDDKIVLFNSITKSCRLQNDRVRIRLPVQSGLLEVILFELERVFGGCKDSNTTNQPYLEVMYKSLFLLSYYGMFRIGEVTISPHNILAKNVHVGENKDKILVILYTSKTHGKESKPQRVKVAAVHNSEKTIARHRHFCPFASIREYMQWRGDYKEDNEPFFVYRDGTGLKATVV